MKEEYELEGPDPLLPSWMTERMMHDTWPFGLMLSTGVTLVIQRILKVNQAADGSLWLDVELNHEYDVTSASLPGPQMSSPTERTDATINAAHIVVAFELADT